MVRNYVDWMLSLPWNEYKDENQDIGAAERTLDEDHFGLEKPKERILEYLAVQSLVGKMKGPILCLVGPPGVGKTSLGKSIARATGRDFVRISLGGVRDEAEIRGHRRTYIGALPGQDHPGPEEGRHQQPDLPARRSRQDVDGLPGRPVGGAPRGARPRAEPHLQRPLPGPRLRPLPGDVRVHGQRAAPDPAPAPGPHGDHPAARLHRVGEAGDRAPVPGAASSARRTGCARSTSSSATRRCSRSSAATPGSPACGTWSASSPRSAARWPARW